MSIMSLRVQAASWLLLWSWFAVVCLFNTTITQGLKWKMRLNLDGDGTLLHQLKLTEILLQTAFQLLTGEPSPAKTGIMPSDRSQSLPLKKYKRSTKPKRQTKLGENGEEHP